MGIKFKGKRLFLFSRCRILHGIRHNRYLLDSWDEYDNRVYKDPVSWTLYVVTHRGKVYLVYGDVSGAVAPSFIRRKFT